MKKYFSYLFISSILLLLAILISINPIQDINGEKSLEGELDLRIQTLENVNIQLSSFLGDKVIVDFFATWCVPCEAQAKLLQRINVAYPSITIISVSVDCVLPC